MEINTANVDKYIKGELDVQHIVIPPIESGCDVTRLFFDDAKREDKATSLEKTPEDSISIATRTFQELGSAVARRGREVKANDCASFRWLRVDKQNGLGVLPVLMPVDSVLLCSGLDLSDGDLVEARLKKRDTTLKVGYFEHDTVMLRSINQTVRPVVADRRDLLLSKVILVKKKKLIVGLLKERRRRKPS